ncbi:MAG: elongation factor 4, partial [Patescibacteria group bacterium]
KVGDKLVLLGTKAQMKVIEIGVFIPHRKVIDKLSAGEVGYVVTSLKDISQLTVGDTLAAEIVPALPGYSPINPVVFMSFYPTEGSEISLMRDALSKLKLTDAALTYAAEHSPALGNGFRVGCLGLLHADIVQERLEREFDLSIIACAPSVAYEILKSDGEVITISKAGDLPDPSFVSEIREPMIKLSIFVSDKYVGGVMQLCQSHRAVLKDMSYVGVQANLVYEMPFSELIREFYDQLKSVSSGYATLDYEIMGFVKADLVRLDVLVNGERVDAFSQIVPRENATFIGKNLVEKLGEAIPRQQYEVAIQAAIGAKIIARADIKAYRKDVTAKLSGGDQTRKDKLLKIQKKGKARMKSVGRVEIPQEAFLAILKV